VNRKDKDNKVSKEVWKVIETKAEKIKIAKIKEKSKK